MNKLKVIVLLVLLSLPAGVYAQDVDFGWNGGSLDIFYDVLNKRGDADLQIFRFSWWFNHFSIGFNIMDIHGFGNFDLGENYTYKDERDGQIYTYSGGKVNVYENDVYRYSFLPLEIAFVPLDIFNTLFLSVYGRAGWLLTQYGGDFYNGLYGSAGIKLFLFHEIDFSYSPYLSFFIEYDTYNRLKIGLGLDLGLLFYLLNVESYRYASRAHPGN